MGFILKQIAIASVPAFAVCVVLCFVSYKLSDYIEYRLWKETPTILDLLLIVSFAGIFIFGAIVGITILYIFVKLVTSLFYLLL